MQHQNDLKAGYKRILYGMTITLGSKIIHFPRDFRISRFERNLTHIDIIDQNEISTDDSPFENNERGNNSQLEYYDIGRQNESNPVPEFDFENASQIDPENNLELDSGNANQFDFENASRIDPENNLEFDFQIDPAFAFENFFEPHDE